MLAFEKSVYSACSSQHARNSLLYQTCT